MIVMSEHPLKFGISGLRGIAGKSLTKDVLEQYISAYMFVLKPHKIMLARDTRASGPEMTEWVIAKLRSYGCEIVYVDITSTPTAQFMVRHLGADGGIAITASHNPPEYNGLKFFDNEGRYLDEIQFNEVVDAFNFKKEPETGKDEQSILTRIDNANEEHVYHILHHIDVEKIKNSGLKVVMDPDGGAGAVIDPILVKELGVDTKIIHGEPSADFPRGTEPTPENLKLLGEAVQEYGADVGFAQDPDADRLALVDETGRPIGEEYTLALCVDYILSRTPNVKGREIAVNMSTSMMMDYVAKKHDVNLIRTKIGEMYVADALVEADGIIGGEGNGGVIWPVVALGRDSIAGMSIILEYLATSGKKISELVQELPKYVMVREKIEVANRDEVDAILSKVKDVYKDENLDLTEGVKIQFEKGWLQVRASNTEPIVRLFAEAESEEMARGWIERVK